MAVFPQGAVSDSACPLEPEAAAVVGTLALAPPSPTDCDADLVEPLDEALLAEPAPLPFFGAVAGESDEPAHAATMQVPRKNAPVAHRTL